MATTNYFRNGYTEINELKKQYKKLAFQLHPDRGGSNAEFQEMSNQYEKALESALRSDYKMEGKIVDELKIDKDMREVLNKIIKLQGIIIEIVGNWLWVTGNTYALKNEIKAAGFKFARKKVAWYWNNGDYKKRSKKQFHLNEIKSMYGVQEVGFDGCKAIN